MANKCQRLKSGELYFSDYPNFRPNLTPRQIFQLGSFGGTYWRPIYSSVVNTNVENIYKQYPKSWWKNIPDKWLITSYDQYDKTINKYNVKVGTTLEYWEGKNWINESHVYGWVHWYCDFFRGMRGSDDERQIKRWLGIAGPNGRFRRRLINMINEKNVQFDDYSVSPKIRQSLQHWAYQITKDDI